MRIGRDSATASVPPVSPQILARGGRAVYLANCVQCRGPEGAGDGFGAPFLKPTANLDPQAPAIFFRRMSDLRRQGRAILFTTQVLADPEALATSAVLLDAGKISPDGARFLDARLRVAAGGA